MEHENLHYLPNHFEGLDSLCAMPHQLLAGSGVANCTSTYYNLQSQPGYIPSPSPPNFKNEFVNENGINFTNMNEVLRPDLNYYSMVQQSTPPLTQHNSNFYYPSTTTSGSEGYPRLNMDANGNLSNRDQFGRLLSLPELNLKMLDSPTNNANGPYFNHNMNFKFEVRSNYNDPSDSMNCKSRKLSFQESNFYSHPNTNDLFEPQVGVDQLQNLTFGSNQPQPKVRGRRASTKSDISISNKTNERHFFCEVDNCNKVFKRSEHLKRHIRSIHSKEKPFRCEICTKTFSRTDNLNQHLRIHTKPKTKVNTIRDQSGYLNTALGNGLGADNGDNFVNFTSGYLNYTNYFENFGSPQQNGAEQEDRFKKNIYESQFQV